MSLITYENLEDGQKVTANIFNERFAQIVAQLNGHINDENLEDDGISKEKLKAEVFESLYPVGSQYVNFTDNTNPATLLGFGVWQAVAGRVTVGYDGSQTEFNAAEKTGGHKALQAHTHNIPRLGGRATTTYGYGSGNVYFLDGSPYASDSSGDGDSGNLQPYIVAYVWKRTS